MIHSAPYVTGVTEALTQPNAIDVTADFLDAHINSVCNTIEIGFGEKQFTPRSSATDEGGYWILSGGGIYDFTSLMTVKVPMGYCGWLVPRSTLARNGVILQSGLYDANYHGAIGGIIHNRSTSSIKLKIGTPVCQFVISQSETVKMYNGYYNQPHTNGGRSIALPK